MPFLLFSLFPDEYNNHTTFTGNCITHTKLNQSIFTKIKKMNKPCLLYWMGFKGFHKSIDLLKTISLIMLLILPLTHVNAQDEYRTNAGILFIKVRYKEKLVNISSKQLLVLLDYETGKIIMKQKVSDLIADNDFLQSWLNKYQDQEIIFHGKLGIDYINTKGHPPLKFDIEGVLSPGDNQIIGQGLLVHQVEKTSSACLLSMNFRLKLEEIFPKINLVGVNDDIYVQIAQSLLAKVNRR